MTKSKSVIKWLPLYTTWSCQHKSS